MSTLQCRLIVGDVADDRLEDGQLAEMDEDESVGTPRYVRSRQRFSRRTMAFLSPRLGLLNNLPMTVPFQTRAEVFRGFIQYVSIRMNADNQGGSREGKHIPI